MSGMPSTRLVRFGTFELNVATGELRKGGARIKLQTQGFQVLLALLEKPGEMVSRQDLCARLWPVGTFVDSEHGLNAVVKKLRIALDDSADNPRFIETLARRGYRFIAPVDTGAAASTAPVSTGAYAGRRGVTLLFVGLCFTLALALVGISRWRANSKAVPPSRTVPLTYYPGEELSPSFSPDVSQVAFSWNGPKQDNYDIYVKTVGSNAAPLRMTTDPSADTRPSWSPDGRYIAFVREQRASANRRGELMILRVHQDGPERKLGSFDPLLPNGSQWGDRLSWSPDSRTISFRSGVSDKGMNGIAAIRIDSGAQNRLTTAPAPTTFDCCPAFSPDGKSLAFWRGSGLAGGLFEIALDSAGAPTGRPRKVAEVAQVWGLDWMPNGRELLYSVYNEWWPLFRIPVRGGSHRGCRTSFEQSHLRYLDAESS